MKILLCWFCQTIVTSTPHRFSVSDNRNRSRPTPNKVTYCIQMFSILNTHTYTRETCRDFGATLYRNTTQFREALRQGHQLSTRNQEQQERSGDGSLLFECPARAAGYHCHLRWMGGGNHAHSAPQAWGQVLGLRPGQGSAGGTGTGIKLLLFSLLRMWDTAPKADC